MHVYFVSYAAQGKKKPIAFGNAVYESNEAISLPLIREIERWLTKEGQNYQEVAILNIVKM